jgi:hypothetical protein
VWTSKHPDSEHGVLIEKIMDFSKLSEAKKVIEASGYHLLLECQLANSRQDDYNHAASGKGRINS